MYTTLTLHYTRIHNHIYYSYTYTHMLRFDEMRPLEPDRKMRGKKRAYKDNFGDRGEEKVGDRYVRVVYVCV